MDDGLGQSSQVLRHHRLQLGQKGDGIGRADRVFGLYKQDTLW